MENKPKATQDIERILGITFAPPRTFEGHVYGSKMQWRKRYFTFDCGNNWASTKVEALKIALPHKLVKVAQ